MEFPQPWPAPGCGQLWGPNWVALAGREDGGLVLAPAQGRAAGRRRGGERGVAGRGAKGWTGVDAAGRHTMSSR